jgi:hypothetical protein
MPSTSFRGCTEAWIALIGICAGRRLGGKAPLLETDAGHLGLGALVAHIDVDRIDIADRYRDQLWRKTLLG